MILRKKKVQTQNKKVMAKRSATQEGGSFKKFKETDDVFQGVSSAIDYWAPTKQEFDDSITYSYEERLQPVGGKVAVGAPLKFTIQETTGNLFTDIFNTQLLISFSMKNGTSTATTVSNDTIGAVPVRDIFFTYFKDVEVHYNGVKVSGTNNAMYGYKNLLRQMMSYPALWKTNEGLRLGYYAYEDPSESDTPAKVKTSAETEQEGSAKSTQPHLVVKGKRLVGKKAINSAVNHWSDAGYQEEDKRWQKSTKIIDSREYIGKIGVDIFNCQHLIPPGVKVEIVMIPHSKKFYMVNFDDDVAALKKYFLEIASAELLVQRRILKESVYESLMQQWELSPLVFPFEYIDAQVLKIPVSATNISSTSMIFPEVPRTMYLALVLNKALAGDSQEDPFIFHPDITEVQINAAGTLIPNHPLKMKMKNKVGEEKGLLRAYYNLVDLTDPNVGIKGNGITPIRGFGLLGFDLTRDGENYNSALSKHKVGQVSINATFETDATNARNLIVFGTFLKEVKITKERKIITPFLDFN